MATGFLRNSRFYALQYILNTWRRRTWRTWRQIWRQIHRVIIITSDYFILYHNITYNKKRRQLATKLAQRQLMAWYKISQSSFPHIGRTAYRTESVLCSFYRHFYNDYDPVVEIGWKGLERPQKGQKWKKCEYSENKYWEVQFFLAIFGDFWRFFLAIFFGDSGVTFGGYNFFILGDSKNRRGE